MSDQGEVLSNFPETLADIKKEEPEDRIYNEASKQRLKTAMDYTLQLLAKNNLISSSTESSRVFNEEHVQIGNKIYEKVVEVLSEYSFVNDEELIGHEESDEGEEYTLPKVVSSSSNDEYEPEEIKMREDPEYISLEYKRMAVNLAKAHPKWNLKSLQTKGASRLKYMRDLKVWEEYVKKGGTRLDKLNTIDTWTNDRIMEARSCHQQVTTRNLKQWALAAASQFPELEFKASTSWVKAFKRRHKIRQRKITRFVSEKESALSAC